MSTRLITAIPTAAVVVGVQFSHAAPLNVCKKTCQWTGGAPGSGYPSRVLSTPSDAALGTTFDNPSCGSWMWAGTVPSLPSDSSWNYVYASPVPEGYDANNCFIENQIQMVVSSMDTSVTTPYTMTVDNVKIWRTTYFTMTGVYVYGFTEDIVDSITRPVHLSITNSFMGGDSAGCANSGTTLAYSCDGRISVWRALPAGSTVTITGNTVWSAGGRYVTAVQGAITSGSIGIGILLSSIRTNVIITIVKNTMPCYTSGGNEGPSLGQSSYIEQGAIALGLFDTIMYSGSVINITQNDLTSMPFGTISSITFSLPGGAEALTPMLSVLSTWQAFANGPAPRSTSTITS